MPLTLFCLLLPTWKKLLGAFINGKHQDSEFDYEKERLLNKQVKERHSQLGLSPRTLKNKQRQLARD